MRRRGVR